MAIYPYSGQGKNIQELILYRKGEVCGPCFSLLFGCSSINSYLVGFVCIHLWSLTKVKGFQAVHVCCYRYTTLLYLSFLLLHEPCVTTPGQ